MRILPVPIAKAGSVTPRGRASCFSLVFAAGTGGNRPARRSAAPCSAHPEALVSRRQCDHHGKKSNAVWLGLKASIGAVIRSQLLTGICAILESPLRAGASKRSDAEVRATVQGLLDREVNRSMASHGGQISIVDVRDGKRFIAMSGGCQGCTASHRRDRGHRRHDKSRVGYEAVLPARRGSAMKISDERMPQRNAKNPF